MRSCPSCKSRDLVAAHVELTHQIGETTYAAEVRATQCNACGNSTVSDSDLERAELSIAEHAMRFSNPDGIKFARKALGMRANELAQLLGVRAETVSRWERGSLQPDRAWFAVLATLAAERLEGRSTLERELRAQGEVHPQPKGIVRIAA